MPYKMVNKPKNIKALAKSDISQVAADVHRTPTRIIISFLFISLSIV